MIKFNLGSVVNPETGAMSNIEVKSTSPNTFKDIIFGGALIAIGIGYLTVSAFKNGAQKMEAAELEALSKIGAIGKNED